MIKSFIWPRKSPRARYVQGKHHIWIVDANPAVLEIGRRVLDYAFEVSGNPLAFFATMTPNLAVVDEMLLAEIEIGATSIIAAQVSNPQARTRLSLSCLEISCDIAGVAWLPGGSGFIYSRMEEYLRDPDAAVVYLYDVIAQETRELFRLPGAAVGHLSVSPDGGKIAFARATELVPGSERFRIGPRLLCPCEIWTATIDGGNLQRIVADGRGPVWHPDRAAGSTLDAIFASSFERR